MVFRIFSLIAICFAQGLNAQISRAIDVRSLSFEEANASQLVEITGVVIFSDPPNTVFIQDETAGTFFRLQGRNAPKAGAEIQVIGDTFPGLYLPGIEKARFKILGKKGMPDPVAVKYEDLASGRFHYQWVEVEGIVRSFSAETEGKTVVKLAVGSEILEVHVEATPPDESEFVDSLVKVSGLAAGRINDRRQLVEPFLRVRSWANFEIMSVGKNVFEIPQVRLNELLTFKVDGSPRHRLQVRGRVLAIFSGTEIFLRDGNEAIRITLSERFPDLRVGDGVLINGFPEMTRYSAVLEDGEVLSHGSPGEPSEAIKEMYEPGRMHSQGAYFPPDPFVTEISGLFEGTLDSNLVRVEGILTDSFRDEDGGVLLVRDVGGTVRAKIAELPSSLVVGSEISVTGICVVEATRGAEYRSTPSAITIRMRGPEDLKILKAPNWWTPQKLGMALAGLVLVVLLGGLWIFMLKRQVRRQTRVLTSRIESEAALEERQRLAREFHDTLEQDLAGLSLRLDAAKALPAADEKMAGFLEGSRNLVGRIQSETRNLVADLRDARDGFADLEHALRELVDELPSDVGPKISLTVSDLEPLPARMVHHLKMITREAITNALKHSGAKEILIAAKADGGFLKLGIADDGCGFEAEAETHGKTGHFGCMGIRERARKLDATVNWNRRESGGTIVVVEANLNFEN